MVKNESQEVQDTIDLAGFGMGTLPVAIVFVLLSIMFIVFNLPLHPTWNVVYLALGIIGLVGSVKYIHWRLTRH